MAIDPTNFVLNSSYNTFKNNTEYTGSFNISGTFSGPAKIIAHSFSVDDPTDIIDVLFMGPEKDPYRYAPGTGNWFKRGAVVTLGDDAANGYSDEPVPFFLDSSIDGTIVTLTARAAKTFVADLSLDTITVNYKLIDYSVF